MIRAARDLTIVTVGAFVGGSAAGVLLLGVYYRIAARAERRQAADSIASVADRMRS